MKVRMRGFTPPRLTPGKLGLFMPRGLPLACTCLATPQLAEPSMSTAQPDSSQHPASDAAGLPEADAAPAKRELLDALRSDRATVREAAVREFLGEVTQRTERMADKMLGPKADRIDLQPESVVMSVMGRELEKLVEVCNDDQHLVARALRAIRNRYIDRLRARKDINPDSRNASGDRTTFDTPDDQDGPRTIVADYEESRAEHDALTRLVTRLAGACKTDDERTMVEQFLLKAQPWSAIASQLGKNETAAKVAFSRLRQRLLETVMQPVQASLAPAEWAVVQAICIDRRSLPDAAEAARGTPQSVLATFQTRILPALRTEYGAAGIESLIRLIGKIRTE